MKLGKLIELLQNSLKSDNKIIYKIGLNTRDKHKKSYLSDVKYEYHIYIVFNKNILSSVSIYSVSEICRDYYLEYKTFYQRELYPLGCGSVLLSESIEMDILEISDIEEDLKESYDKVFKKKNEANMKTEFLAVPDILDGGLDLNFLEIENVSENKEYKN